MVGSPYYFPILFYGADDAVGVLWFHFLAINGLYDSDSILIFIRYNPKDLFPFLKWGYTPIFCLYAIYWNGKTR